MSKCQGLPDGRCPRNVNNRTAKSTQGDLWLCPSCEAVRFPYTAKQASPHRRRIAESQKQLVRNTLLVLVQLADETDKNNHSDDEHDCVIFHSYLKSMPAVLDAIYDTIRYDTIWYVFVRSKAAEMTSLVKRTAQKRK